MTRTAPSSGDYALLPMHEDAGKDKSPPANLSISTTHHTIRGDKLKKVASAAFYGSSSVLIVFVNKILLTNLNFPSFLFIAIGQMAVTVFLLAIAKTLNIVSFPALERSVPRRIFPLPLFYVMNLVSGLGGTQRTNLPMFTVLRRFSILMTMMLEYAILEIHPTFAVKVSVFLMILGSFVAGIYDLSFDAYGYALIFVNNVFTAANGVYVKKKLESRDLGKYGLLYYNSLFMLAPTVVFVLFFTDDLRQVYDYFTINGVHLTVVFCFTLSCVCGFILNYSLVLCSTFNTALTTTCVGPIKNLIVTYVGMVSSSDYVFSWANFTGVNISVFGSVVYTYVTFRSPYAIAGGRPAGRQLTIRPKERRSDWTADDRPLFSP